MAQLKDLIVYGDAKFLGDVTLDHDPTKDLHAATKAYVDSQVGTGTDEKLKVAALTSGTEYLPILAVSNDSGAAATRQIDKNAQALKYICTPGTSGGTSGTAQLILGNNINGGYANSATGVLTLYGASIYGVDIKYNGAYLNQTLLIPGPTANDQTNYFVTKVGSAAIGAADQPVYIDSSGHAVVANKNLWGFSSGHGVFYPNDVSTTGNTFGSGSLTVLGHDIKGLTGIRTSMSSLNMLGQGNQNLSASTAADSTTYVLASSQNIGANSSNIVAANTYYYSTDGLAAQKPTSVDNNGSTLTFASTLNPNSAISKISFANYDSSGMSMLCGAGLTNTAACNLLVGLKIYTTGFYNLAVGSLNYTGGMGSAVTGIRNYVNASYTLTTGYGNTNVKDGAFVSGAWHDTTNGPDYLAAVGKYSNITSTSAFVVGNGTGPGARSNAFEVHTDGRATVGADPTANLDVATKQYVDNGPFISIIYNDVSEDGATTIHFNHFTSNPTTYNELVYSTEFQVALKKVIPVYIGVEGPTMLLTQGILYGGLSGLLSTSWTILFPDSVEISGVGLVNGITGGVSYTNDKWVLTNVQPHTSPLIGALGVWGLTSQGGAVYPASTKNVSTLPTGNIAVLGDGDHQVDLAKVTSGKTGNVIVWGNVSNVIVSAPAGSTSYTINSATYTMPDGSTDELSELYFFIEDSVAPQKPTSVTFNSDSKPVLTFASSLNPTAENTHIYVAANSERHANLIVGYGATSIKDASVIVGNFLYNGGINSLIAGQKNTNTGSVSTLAGVRLKNTKNGSFLAGDSNFNNSNAYSALIGQGHYNTSGPVGTTAVGVYSSITSTTQFVVGNGTSASARSNAFEVTTTGEAKAASFTENGTSLVDKYAAKTHTHGDISSTGAITTNPGTTIASGDALIIADASLGNTIKKSATTFGTSTTTYLRNDGTWGTPSGADTKVTQSAITGTSTTTFYPILLAYGTGQTATATNTANFTANASVTPAGDIYGSTFHYGTNAYTQYNSTLKAIEFCFA